MKQRHLLSGNPINLANFPKLPVLTFYILLFTCLLTTGVKAVDITQQIHRPLNSSVGKLKEVLSDLINYEQLMA